jgi:hypothetical protein
MYPEPNKLSVPSFKLRHSSNLIQVEDNTSTALLDIEE